MPLMHEAADFVLEDLAIAFVQRDRSGEIDDSHVAGRALGDLHMAPHPFAETSVSGRRSGY